jgi:endonuclease/exonuclease/phosphatase family metal-dependent hydrolase
MWVHQSKIKVLAFIILSLIASNQLKSSEETEPTQTRVRGKTISKTPALTIMTLNTYTFSKGLSKALEIFLRKEGGLVPGITKSINQRIDEIAHLVKQENPDVVVFQELWGIDNKKRMLKDLGCKDIPFFSIVMKDKFNCPTPTQYTYNFLDSSIFTASFVDSGLMIASKFPIVWAKRIVFPDSLSDEKMAKKGALLVRIEDRMGKAVFIVNSHLQSGAAHEYIILRNREMLQIGYELAKAIRESGLGPKDYRIIILGDFNDPIKFIADKKLLTDRTTFMIKALKSKGINVSNDQVTSFLANKLGAQKILDIDEFENQIALKLPLGQEKELDSSDPDYRYLQSASGNPAQGGYFRYASDNPGIQLLDHIFLDDNSRLLNYRVLRNEVLKDPELPVAPDQTPAKTYDPKTAISDHAAVMVEIADK